MVVGIDEGLFVEECSVAGGIMELRKRLFCWCSYIAGKIGFQVKSCTFGGGLVRPRFRCFSL